MPRKTGGKAADQNAEHYFKLLCNERGITESDAVALFNGHIKSTAEHGGRGTLPWALDYLNKKKSTTRADAKRMLAGCAGVTTQQAGNYLNGKTPTPRSAVVNIIGKLAERIELDEGVPYWGPLIGNALENEYYAEEFQIAPEELETYEGEAYSYAFSLLIDGTTPFEADEVKMLKVLYIVSRLKKGELDGLLAMLRGFKPGVFEQAESASDFGREYMEFTPSDESVKRDQALLASLKATVDEISETLDKRAAASPMKLPGYITNPIPFD